MVELEKVARRGQASPAKTLPGREIELASDTATS
jgi:hypothetical protein